MDNLTGKQIEQLVDVLISAYPSRDDLRIMVRIELDEMLEEIADGANQRVVIFNLVTWAVRSGRIDALLAGAQRQNAGNPKLAVLMDAWQDNAPAGSPAPRPPASNAPAGPPEAELLLREPPMIAEVYSTSLTKSDKRKVNLADKHDRINWLRGHFLSQDPFSPNSDRAEDDNLLHDRQHPFAAYVQPGMFDQILENTYIVMSSGGGRTALCQWIEHQYDRGNLDKPPQKTLAAYYSLQRTHSVVEHFHIIRSIITSRLGISLPESSATGQDAVVALYDIFCKSAGYTDLCILVEPSPDSQWGELAKEAELLNRTGIRFHFFLDRVSFAEYKDELDLRRFRQLVLELTSDWARRALRCRCEACLSPGINADAFSLESLFEQRIRTQVIEAFVEIGVKTQSFREMWRFGNALINRHLDTNGEADARSLVSVEEFRSVLEQTASVERNSVTAANRSEHAPLESEALTVQPQSAGLEVFISYAWGDESEAIVSQLEKVLQERNVLVVRDKSNLKYRGLLREFMQRIGRGRAVIVVISDRYLKSRNCMYELTEIAANGNMYDRVFPIVLSDAEIYEPLGRIHYIEYWENKINELDEAMKRVSSANLQGLRDDIDNYTRIRGAIATLTDMLSNMNVLAATIHQDTGFAELSAAVEAKLVL